MDQIKPADNSDLAPELRPLAEAHGRVKLDFALRVAAMEAAVEMLVNMGKTQPRMRGAVGVLANGLADCCNDICRANEWDFIKDIVSLLPKIAEANSKRKEGPKLIVVEAGSSRLHEAKPDDDPPPAAA